jgi:hypothetical protein
MYPGLSGKPISLSMLLESYHDDNGNGLQVAYTKSNGVTQIEITRHGNIDIRLPNPILPAKILKQKSIITGQQ